MLMTNLLLPLTRDGYGAFIAYPSPPSPRKGTGRENWSANIICSAAAGLALLALAGGAQAKVYGLVVGINAYEKLNPLKGAVNDAEDVADALKGIGADVSKLINAEATRARVESEWKRIVASAGRGDVFVFSYAGHGGQEPHKPRPDDDASPDPIDEAFLLSGFNPDRKNAAFGERIVDKDFKRWLKAAAAKGIKLLVVADSCFSGGMTRSAGLGSALPSRYTPPYGEEPGLTMEAAREQSAKRPEKSASDGDIDGVSFMAAVADNKQSPEVLIAGKPRGALSYAVARALRGGVATSDGRVSPFDIQRFVQPQIVQISEGLQVPDFKPLKLSTEPLLQLARKQAGAGSGTFAVNVAAAVRVAVEGGAALPPGLSGAIAVADRTEADLYWKPGTREVQGSLGDIVAVDVDGGKLQGVVDKWRVLPGLKSVMEGRTVGFTLSGGFRTYIDGETLSVNSGALAGQRYVAVLDLGPDGGVELFSTLEELKTPWPDGKPFRMDGIAVLKKNGFGADHILLISSTKPLAHVFANRRLTSAGLPALLEVALADATFEMGLAFIYTREKQ